MRAGLSSCAKADSVSSNNAAITVIPSSIFSRARSANTLACLLDPSFNAFVVADVGAVVIEVFSECIVSPAKRWYGVRLRSTYILACFCRVQWQEAVRPEVGRVGRTLLEISTTMTWLL